MVPTHSDFIDFSPESVRAFVLEKAWLDEEEAKKLVDHKVDGSILLESSIKDVVEVYKVAGGPAKRLVTRLKEMFPAGGGGEGTDPGESALLERIESLCLQNQQLGLQNQRALQRLQQASNAEGSTRRAVQGAAMLKGLEQNNLISYFQANDDVSMDLPSDVILKTQTVKKEAQLTGLLQPFLENLVAGAGYVVVNSEEHQWLNGNKPDVFFVPDGCWESKHRTEKLYPAGKYGIIANSKLYCMCRSLGDMKMRQKTDSNITFVGAFANKDRGQIIDYAVDLGGSVNCFLVNNALQFELYEFRNYTAKRLIRGSLRDTGSGKYFQSFLCRPNDPVPEAFVSMNMAIESLQVKIVSGKGFLGAGGSAHVYQVMKQNQSRALKIFKLSATHLGNREASFLNSQLLSPLCQSNEVPSLVQSSKLENGAVCLLISPVGRAMEYRKQHVELAMRALARLHQSGVCHGDARVPNFVVDADSSKILPIDFTFSSAMTDQHNAEQDMFRFISSFYKLQGSNDLSCDASSQLSCALSEEGFQAICSLVQTYVTGGYQIEHAVLIAQKVCEIKETLAN